MSTLKVEVCQVKNIQRHPNADRLAVVEVNGWQVCIGFDPDTQKADFEENELCVFFPPDSILPLALGNSPHKVCKNKECKLYNKPQQIDTCECGSHVDYKDGTPGRTGARAYCVDVSKDGTVIGSRVRAARLRGVQSFGFILKIDSRFGDDPNWAIGTDVKEHFGVTKWEPPIESNEGDSEADHPRFHRYTDIEHFANFPDALTDGEEVVMTEKIHGKNARVGMVLDTNESGEACWTWMAGSHSNRRKEFFSKLQRFDAVDLVERKILSSTDVVQTNFVFLNEGGKLWRITEVMPRAEDSERFLFRAEEVVKLGDGSYQTKLGRSEFWATKTDGITKIVEYIRDMLPWHERKTSIIIFGEIFGSGVQDLAYGLSNGVRGFRVFDIAVNRQYLDYDTVEKLCRENQVLTVPVLYRGPFSRKVLEQYTDGPTTMTDAKKIKGFSGREGVVVKPVKERITDQMVATSTNGRVIFKSISADYHARKGGTEFH